MLFYTRGNQGKSGISRHDMTIGVRDGKPTYPPDRSLPFDGKRDFTLAEFKKEITSRIGKATVEDTPAADPPAATPTTKQPVGLRAPGDLSGKWRMLLPAGFEHETSLDALSDKRYHLECAGSRFSGIYELRDKKLVIVEPTEPRFASFMWEMRSPHLLTLVEQLEKLEHDYRGAVLFRLSAAASER